MVLKGLQIFFSLVVTLERVSLAHGPSSCPNFKIVEVAVSLRGALQLGKRDRPPNIYPTEPWLRLISYQLRL